MPSLFFCAHNGLDLSIRYVSVTVEDYPFYMECIIIGCTGTFFPRKAACGEKGQSENKSQCDTLVKSHRVEH